MAWRFSIRGLLFTVAFVSVACAALKYAGPVWWHVLAAAAMLLFMGAAVMVAAGKDEPRAKAVSFLLCFAIYAALVGWSPANELDVTEGRLPTTKAVEPLVANMRYRPPRPKRPENFGDVKLELGDGDILSYGFYSEPSGPDGADRQTRPQQPKNLGDVKLELGDSDILSHGFYSAPSGPNGADGIVGVSAYLRDTSYPEHSELLRIAHLLWAMLFGFLGASFGGVVYRRNLTSDNRPDS